MEKTEYLFKICKQVGSADEKAEDAADGSRFPPPGQPVSLC